MTRMPTVGSICEYCGGRIEAEIQRCPALESGLCHNVPEMTENGTGTGYWTVERLIRFAKNMDSQRPYGSPHERITKRKIAFDARKRAREMLRVSQYEDAEKTDL